MPPISNPLSWSRRIPWSMILKTSERSRRVKIDILSHPEVIYKYDQCLTLVTQVYILAWIPNAGNPLSLGYLGISLILWEKMWEINVKFTLWHTLRENFYEMTLYDTNWTIKNVCWKCEKRLIKWIFMKSEWNINSLIHMTWIYRGFQDVLRIRDMW